MEETAALFAIPYPVSIKEKRGGRWFPQCPPTGGARRADVPAIDRAGTSAVAMRVHARQ
jgi:hypothetical protein